MQYILFKTCYLDLIKSGQKTQTVRLWKRHKSILPGDTVIATNQTIKLKIKIKSIKQKHVHQLTLAEIQKDGFRTKQAFYDALIKFYNSTDFIATVIEFDYMGLYVK